MKQIQLDSLQMNVYETRELMGQAAGKAIEDTINKILLQKNNIRIIFAAAPSQNEVLAYLKNSKNIDWSKITCFHMDEYIGLPIENPALFSNFLDKHLFDELQLSTFYKINSLNEIQDEINRYEQLLREAPIDICIMGIGENGHIAFNDPPFAKFDDMHFVKEIQLDNISRQQQVNDGCFKSIQEVPTHAITLTIPALISAEKIFCIVPGPTKTEALYRLIEEEINENMPATILRKHVNALLFTDESCYQKG
ncbi:6-phosphogluconolactonase [Solibacillus sp. FSL K6-4121]|uniref:6-phosphogluconolactonase n=1 Tax=Solibacillus sp. FSL K6-4121 TaxID=2921505 RepID=UPI0030FB56C5